MTKRILRVVVDCDDETCGPVGSDGCGFQSEAFGWCTHFKDQEKVGKRSAQCLAAESKALAKCGAT
jgi:hypothetical protein